MHQYHMSNGFIYMKNWHHGTECKLSQLTSFDFWEADMVKCHPVLAKVVTSETVIGNAPIMTFTSV